ncbi:uncharacterized protein DS421_17g582160 [Arachis hypogaea]|nr:uncharacterized protein DS421_17g582160 [Arachis hypogaea]
MLGIVIIKSQIKDLHEVINKMNMKTFFNIWCQLVKVSPVGRREYNGLNFASPRSYYFLLNLHHIQSIA